jgi:hypothetical protein
MITDKMRRKIPNGYFQVVNDEYPSKADKIKFIKLLRAALKEAKPVAVWQYNNQGKVF